ncbi:MAG TPA: hypothetical protein PKH92_13915, partial [Anaerolineaceae bacterium]|nr:hypothetical protein [Anaerolineaceae bacterium]
IVYLMWQSSFINVSGIQSKIRNIIESSDIRAEKHLCRLRAITQPGLNKKPAAGSARRRVYGVMEAN